jgi:predicted Zn-dependent protease
MRISGMLATAVVLALAACAPSLTTPAIDAAAVKAEQKRQAELLKAPGARVLAIHTDVAPDARCRAGKVLDALVPATVPVCAKVDYRCFFVVRLQDGSTVNAFASGEADVTVYAGLLGLLESDDELAFVLAHEFGHHLAQHNAETNRRARIGGAIGGIIMGSLAYIAGAGVGTQIQAVDAGETVGLAVGSRVHSKDEEREADYLGAYLAERAGYDAAAALTLFDRMALLEGTSALKDGFLATHPSTPDRAARLRATLTEITDKKRRGAEVLPNFD